MEALFNILTENKNEDNAYYMSKYMKFKFPYLGIKTPERKALTKCILVEKSKSDIDWNFVFDCFNKDEREFLYVGIDYLSRVKDKFIKDDIEHLEALALIKSWWDSIDSIAPLVGYMVMKHPELKEEKIALWIESDNIWLKRLSIIFQLKFKMDTDLKFLECAIKKNAFTGEFFVDKAIGWQLRELSKTNKEWVRQFMKENQLSKLSIREGSKYI